MAKVIRGRLFDTPQKCEKVAHEMRQLKMSEGWMILKQVIEENMEATKEEILDIDDNDAKKMENLKLQYHYMEILKELPDNLEETAQSGGDSEEGIKDFDPFA